MCGFSGERRSDGRWADVRTVAAMADTMQRRGPDGSGVYAMGQVALAHQRLKVIDLSDKAAQPMVDPELGLSTVFNGCIYNYSELRAQLTQAGYTFFSSGDTEVVLKAYDHWGDDFVSRLQGMFAFCIVERDSSRMLLGRDRLGIKPLYIAETSGALRFASTLPALVAGGGVDTTIDSVALHHYLTFHSVVPAPRTILKGVRKLEPATTLAIEPDGRRTKTTYWSPNFMRDPEMADWSPRDWEDAVLASLRTAVQRRLVSDVPVGVLLSGGLDSSLIVGLLAEAGQHGLSTFSVGFESVGGEQGDEFRYSDVVAAEFGTDHHQLHISTERMLPALSDAIGAMSEPMVSHDAVGFYLLSQEVAKTTKVVQSGQGADEVFGGYHWYPPLLAAGAAGDGGLDTYAQAFFDRRHADRSRATPGHGRHAGRRPRQARGQYDHGMGAGGARALPGPRASRARRRLPAGAQARPGRQGRAQGGRPARDPLRRHRPAQGLLPGPRAQVPAGPVPGARAQRADRTRGQGAWALRGGRCESVAGQGRARRGGAHATAWQQAVAARPARAVAPSPRHLGRHRGQEALRPPDPGGRHAVHPRLDTAGRVADR